MLPTACTLFRVLSQQPELTGPQGALYESCLDQLISPSGTVENLELQKLLVRHLYKERRLEKLTRVALLMADWWPDTSYPLEWVCKVYLEWAAHTLGRSTVPLRSVGVR